MMSEKDRRIASILGRIYLGIGGLNVLGGLVLFGILLGVVAEQARPSFAFNPGEGGC